MVFHCTGGGEKDLDRVGSCSSRNFYVVSEHEGLRFVDFDLHRNTLLHLGSENTGPRVKRCAHRRLPLCTDRKTVGRMA